MIERAVRQQLGLDLLDRLWERADLGEEEATALAVEAQHETRPEPSVRVVLDTMS